MTLTVQFVVAVGFVSLTLVAVNIFPEIVQETNEESPTAVTE